MPGGSLTQQQRQFCQEYTSNGGNGAKAARDVGYSSDRARMTASDLLKRPEIQAEIAKLRDAQAKAAETKTPANANIVYLPGAYTGGNGGQPPSGNDTSPLHGEPLGFNGLGAASLLDSATYRYLVESHIKTIERAHGNAPTREVRSVKKVVVNEDGTKSEQIVVVAVEVRITDNTAATAATKALFEMLEKGADAKARAEKDARPGEVVDNSPGARLNVYLQEAFASVQAHKRKMGIP